MQAKLSDDNTAIERLANVEPSIISDCMVRVGLSGWLNGIRPVRSGRTRAIGRARTVMFAPRYGGTEPAKSLYAIISSLRAGDVLVIGCAGSEENLLGDNMATFASRAGVAAIVTDSMVRDSLGIGELSMPVCARGTAVRMMLTLEPAAVDGPVICGGAQIRLDDLVVCCEDGVLTIPSSRVDEVLYELEEVEALEKELRKSIESGASLPAIEAIVKRRKARRARTA